jgi:hypothetical protein
VTSLRAGAVDGVFSVVAVAAAVAMAASRNRRAKVRCIIVELCHLGNEARSRSEDYVGLPKMKNSGSENGCMMPLLY